MLHSKLFSKILAMLVLVGTSVAAQAQPGFGSPAYSEEGGSDMVTVTIDNAEGIDRLEVNYRAVEYQTGENTYPIDRNAVLVISLVNNGKPHEVTLNGVPQDIFFWTPNYYEINIAAGDQVNIITDAQNNNDVVDVTIDNAEGIARLEINYRAVEYQTGENTYPIDGNAVLVISLVDNGKPHEVTLNGVPQDIFFWTPNYYEINIAAGDHVNIITGEGVESGAELVDDADMKYDVFNLNGVRIASSLGISEIRNLAKGVYVINGKVFTVK